jgi:hypothetical protein
VYCEHAHGVQEVDVVGVTARWRYEMVDAPFTQELDTFRGQDIVVPLPRKAGLHVALRRKALQGLDNFEIRHVKLLMLRGVEVLLRNKDTLWAKTCLNYILQKVATRTLEQVLVDDAPVLLGNDHGGR